LSAVYQSYTVQVTPSKTKRSHDNDDGVIYHSRRGRGRDWFLIFNFILLLTYVLSSRSSRTISYCTHVTHIMSYSHCLKSIFSWWRIIVRFMKGKRLFHTPSSIQTYFANCHFFMKWLPTPQYVVPMIFFSQNIAMAQTLCEITHCPLVHSFFMIL